MARRLEGSTPLGPSFAGVAAGSELNGNNVTVPIVTHMYLAQDAAAASDANAGNDPALPLLTLNEVLRRLNRLVRIDSPVVVHIATPTLPYVWGVELGPVQLEAPLVFIGDGGGQAGDDGFDVVASSTALSGTSDVVLVTVGLVVDAHFGQTLEITSGLASGVRRSIFENTATNVTFINSASLGFTDGDTFRILEPTVQIAAPAVVLAAADTRLSQQVVIRGVGTGGAAVNGGGGNIANLYFVNLDWRADETSALGIARMSISGSSVCFIGGLFTGGEDTAGFGWQLRSDDASLVQMGGDALGISIPEVFGAFPAGLVGLNADPRLWAGWTPFASDNGRSFAQGIKRSKGYWVTSLNGQISFVGGIHEIYGARVEADSDNAALFLSNNAVVRVDGLTTTNTRFHNVGNDSETSCVMVRANSALHLSQCEVRKTNLGGGIVIWGDGSGQDMLAGVVSLSDSVTLNAITDTNQPDFALAVSGGGRCNFRPNPTVTGTWVGQIKVAIGPATAPTAAANGTFASLAADGDAYPQGAALPAFLVHGVVQRR